MAWLSVGTSNEDLCAKLVENGVLQEGDLLEAFRFTDRGDFVENEDRLQAYADRPFKKGKLHLSAPHMYVTVLEALDLRAGKSFLNIGSGSGYLSCLAAYLLGEEGVSHGVEVSEAACSFSRERARVWHAKLVQRFEAAASSGTPIPGGMIPADGISFVHANCFDLDVLSAAHTLKYDRIYVGAGCPDSRKEFFLSMLGDNGVMVVPINERNQMLSIRKFCGRVYSAKPISNVNFAPLLDTAERPDEQALLGELAALEGMFLGGDLQECIRRVQAAPSSASFIIHPLTVPAPPSPVSLFGTAASTPGGPLSTAGGSGTGPDYSAPHRVRLPSLVWAPSRARHMQFPPEFRRAVFTILLANNRSGPRYCVSGRGGSAATAALAVANPRCHPQCHCRSSSRGSVGFYLPHQIWLQVFSFASREWFFPPKSELHAVGMELAVERRLRRSAEDKLRRAETTCRDYERKLQSLQLEVQRLRRRCSTSVLGGSYMHGHAGGGLAAYMDLLAGSVGFEDEEEEEEYGDVEEEEEESESDGEESEAEDVWGESEEEEEEDGGEGEGEEAGAADQAESVAEAGQGQTVVVPPLEQEQHAGGRVGEEQVVPIGVYGPATTDSHQHPQQQHPQQQPEDEGEPMVVETAQPASPALTSSSGGSGNEGVWVEVGDQEGESGGGSDRQSSAAYWSAYQGYLQTMPSGRGNGNGNCHGLGSSSYGSTLTGTTAESLASYYQLGASASMDGNHQHWAGRRHSHSFGGERISDFSADTASWEEEDEEDGNNASDHAEAFFPAHDG